MTNAYRAIDLVVDEIKCQWVGITDSIMERLEESLPPRNLVVSPNILAARGMQSALAAHLGSSGLAQLVASAAAVLGPVFEALLDPRPCASQCCATCGFPCMATRAVFAACCVGRVFGHPRPGARLSLIHI